MAPRGGILAVDLDETLTEWLPALQSYFELDPSTPMAHSKYKEVWESLKEERKKDFYTSPHLKKMHSTTANAVENLKKLRNYFTLYLVTDRPRYTEILTRNWIDRHYPGIFDKLVFLDTPSGNNQDPSMSQRELYETLHVQIAIGTDGAKLQRATDKLVPYAVQVGTLSYAEPVEDLEKIPLHQVDSWEEMYVFCEETAKQLKLTKKEKPHVGPKFSKFLDEVVTISKRRNQVSIRMSFWEN